MQTGKSECGRVALVSGATGELGSAICQRLLKAGMHVEMLGRDALKLREARQRIAEDLNELNRLGTEVIDITDADSVQQAVRQLTARLPRIDLLVHAAGDGPVAPLLETTEAQWQGTLQGKLMGTVRLTKAVVAEMRAHGEAQVIIINGTFAKEPHPMFPINSAVNCALAGFAKAVSHDLGFQGIRVNVVNPGVTDSPLWGATARNLADRFGVTAEEVSAQLIAKNPLGRFASPKDVAEVVALLAHPVSAYLNGVAIDVDGGAVSAL
jgi:3-oxoacyl-[acyl-carrier protein] reductase